VAVGHPPALGSATIYDLVALLAWAWQRRDLGNFKSLTSRSGDFAEAMMGRGCFHEHFPPRIGAESGSSGKGGLGLVRYFRRLSGGHCRGRWRQLRLSTD